MEWIKSKKNAATQLLGGQSQHLAELKSRGMIDDFQQVELQRILKELF